MTDMSNDKSSKTSETLTIGDLIARRYSRRSVVKGSLAVSVGAGLATFFGCAEKTAETPVLGEAPVNKAPAKPAPRVSSFDFTEIQHGRGDHHHLAPDHEAEVLIRWGDPIFEHAPEFDPYAQSADAQEKQFGYNNDFIGYWPLDAQEGQESRSLLCINHEYTETKMMFTGMQAGFSEKNTAEQTEIEKAAVGCSVIEIEKTGGKWQVNPASKYNRRINARSTECEMTGPVAGDKRLKTSADSTAKKVIGTMSNCAGGMTPWGTYLSCEENINANFLGTLAEGHPETENHRRYDVPYTYSQWGKFDSRFDLGIEPNEPNRFGWVVEIDPLDPTSIPKKRTALGRFQHEGAENVIAPDGRLVIYMGDDKRFDYVYKFVTRGRVNLATPSANTDLLDHGTLYVAKFKDDGTVLWLPIVFGTGPLTAKNGFNSQADVLIETRRAADLLEATPMDRPEDVVPNPKTGKIYVMLTNNTGRSKDKTNAANPRAPNTFGHIIEITEPRGDFTSTKSNWDFLIKAGSPDQPEVDAKWHRETSENGWFASPDNGVIDPGGRLWVSTDQAEKVSLSGTSDGLWALETEGNLRGKGKMFFRCPEGAELCGPAFSPDRESLFVAVQHPGDSDDPKINFDHPGTRWPDFKPDIPPRSSILVIQRKGGGKVG